MSEKVDIIFFIFFFSISLSFAQCNTSDLKEKMLTLKDIPMEVNFESSKDSSFWTMFQIEYLPCLLKLVEDTSTIEINGPYFGGYYVVGDVAVQIVTTLIVNFPLQDMMKDVNPEFIPSDGGWNYWLFVRKSCENRKLLKERLISWFQINKDKLIKNDLNADSKYQLYRLE